MHILTVMFCMNNSQAVQGYSIEDEDVYIWFLL